MQYNFISPKTQNQVIFLRQSHNFSFLFLCNKVVGSANIGADTGFHIIDVPPVDRFKLFPLSALCFDFTIKIPLKQTLEISIVCFRGDRIKNQTAEDWYQGVTAFTA